jgi:hypothetical protein
MFQLRDNRTKFKPIILLGLETARLNSELNCIYKPEDSTLGTTGPNSSQQYLQTI